MHVTSPRRSLSSLGFFRFITASALALLFTAAAYAAIGVGLQMQTGNPSSATTNPNNHTHYLISDRAQYAMDYNDTTREPNWVAWDLTAGDVGGSGRSSFIVDTTLPAGFYQVQTTDYSGSGYDRGHMCPSADRTVTAADNQIVFYMSNMIPQAPDNNQGVWASFESYCRTLASAGNELLIIAGPSGFGGSSIASGVAIPGYTWKIAVVVPPGPGTALSRITASTRVITIKIPNIAGVRSTPWQNFVTSVNQIEADTGYTFFDQIPAATATTLKGIVDGQTVAGAPVITGQPTAQTTAVGGNASFSVTATGNAPLSYQWYKDDAEISGATNATLDLTNVTGSDAGSYTVAVTNSVGAATSNAAALIVTGVPPSITTSPAPETVAAGSSVVFSVAATGSPTLTYQWRHDGTPVSGGTATVLTLNNVQSTDAGAYDVVVTNSTGTATSATAALAVTPAAPTIITQPATQTATGSTNVTFTVVARGTAPLGYQWRKGGSNLSNTGNVSGATSATLTLSSVTSSDAGSYDVVVTNTVGSATSNAATLTVNAATIYWDFAAATPTSGVPADISVGALTRGNSFGASPPALLTSTSASNGYTGASGTNNAGVPARTGVLNKVADGTGSAYFEVTLTPAAGKKLVVSGISFGTRSTSTGPAAFSVFTSFDNYGTAVATGSITPTTGGSWGPTAKTPAMTTVTGSTDQAITLRLYGHDGGGTASQNTVNWRIDDLKITASTVIPSSAVAPAVVTVSPANGTNGVTVSSPISVTFNQAVTVSSGWFTITSATSGPITATVTGGPITYTLTPPTNFTYGDTINVTFLAGKVTENDTHTLTLPANYNFSFNTGLPVAPSIATDPQSKTVAEFGSTTFTVVATGTAPLNYQWRKNGTPISGNATATNATLSLTNVSQTDAGNYDCVVSNVAGSATSNAAALTITLVAPSIVTPPATRTISLGGSTSFSVVAAGSAPLSYHWRKNGTNLVDGGGVTGSNTATLTITNATAASAGSYDVIVTNPVTSVTSSAAALNVTTATFSVVTWNFDSATNPADPSSGLPADLTGGTVTQGNNNGTTTLITSASSSGSGFSGNNNAGAAARTGALNQAVGGSAYFEFTLTPAAGKQIVATALSFGARSTPTGPQAFAVFSSADNFTAAIASGTQPNNSVWVLNTPVSGGARGTPGAPLTFRIYGYNGTGSPGSGTANWRIDDLKLTVGTELPPAVASTSPTANAAGVLVNAPISITFNQAVNATGTWASVTSTLHGAVATTISGGPTTYTLTPASSWSYSDTITVNVAAASVSDLTGTLAMPANYSFSFATVVPVSFTPPPASQTVTVGDSVNFGVGAAGTAPLSYQWAKNGAPISGATSTSLALGPVTTADAGSYTVDVTNPAGTFTSPAAVLTVNPATPAVAWATPAPIVYGTALDVTQLNATASVPGSFAYSPAAGSVLNAGLRTLSVTFTPTDTANYLAVTQTTTISVSKATPALTWTTPAPITYGTALGATQLAAGANVPGSFAYSPAAGTVLNAGPNQALAVTFTPADTNNFTTASAGTTITVNRATPAITWPTPAPIVYGTGLTATQLSATANVGGTFAFSPAVGAVLNAGDQTLSATFTPSDAGNYTTATATVTLTVNKATPTITWAAPAPITYGTALDGTQLNATADAAGSFAYSPAAGTVLTVGSQTLSATFTPADAANYNSATATRSLTVNKATPAITWPAPAAIVYGTALSGTQLNATADVPGSFAYSPDVGAILNAGATTLNATFTPTDTANYNGATATRSLTVTPKPVVITLGGLAQTYDGTAKSASFTTDVAAAAAFVQLSYTPSSPVAAGSYAVTATLTSANYSGTASGNLVIAKATPALAWNPPAAITYGTALGASQLNATANVGGSFTYTPAAGTVLNAGVGQALSATFAPADAANYNGGSVSTTITVNKAVATVTLANLTQPYDGTPKSATVTTTPTGLTVDVSYNGSPAAPTLPGSYAVIATVNDANYTGSATGTLLIGITAIVRHAPVLTGDLDGSLQVLLPESMTLSGPAMVSGDLLVPGLPTVQLSGHPTYGGTQDGSGAATPSNYSVTLTGNAVLRHVVRRTDAITLPTIVAPPASTQNVALAGNAGATTLAPGNYGNLTAGGSSSFVLGIAGATTPAVYNAQSLTLGGNATLQIVGPVVLTLANGTTLSGTTGDATHPEWLTLAVANGGVTVSGGATFRGAIVAPNGTVTISGAMRGTVSADRLAIGGSGLLEAP